MFSGKGEQLLYEDSEFRCGPYEVISCVVHSVGKCHGVVLGGMIRYTAEGFPSQQKTTVCVFWIVGSIHNYSLFGGGCEMSKSCCAVFYFCIQGGNCLMLRDDSAPEETVFTILHDQIN